MLTYPTLDQLRALRLEGMARALEEQHAHPAIEALTFDERLACCRLPDSAQIWRR